MIYNKSITNMIPVSGGTYIESGIPKSIQYRDGDVIKDDHDSILVSEYGLIKKIEKKDISTTVPQYMVQWKGSDIFVCVTRDRVVDHISLFSPFEVFYFDGYYSSPISHWSDRVKAMSGLWYNCRDLVIPTDIGNFLFNIGKPFGYSVGLSTDDLSQISSTGLIKRVVQDYRLFAYRPEDQNLIDLSGLNYINIDSILESGQIYDLRLVDHLHLYD